MFGIIGAIIGAVVSGTITGLLARAVLPGTQNIGIGKTISVGVIANLIVSLILAPIIGGFLGFFAGIAVGAGLITVGINKGYLQNKGLPSPPTPRDEFPTP